MTHVEIYKGFVLWGSTENGLKYIQDFIWLEQGDEYNKHPGSYWMVL